MPEYYVASGDTFESVARIQYGREDYDYRVRRANPGVVEPLIVGTRLVVPVDIDSPQQSVRTTVQTGEDDIALEIEGATFERWTDVVLRRSIDKFDTFQVSGPLDDREERLLSNGKDPFRPLSFYEFKMFVGQEVLFNGTILNADPNLDSESNTVTIDGYSLPGVLGDCTAPISAYPIDYRDVGLRTIAQDLCEPFGLRVVFEDPDRSEQIFDEAGALAKGTPVLVYLSRLAAQREYVIGSSEEGELVFRRSVLPGKPVAQLVSGQAPLLNIQPMVDAQNFFSHITVSETRLFGGTGEPATEPIKHVGGVLRPFVFESGEASAGDLGTILQTKVGRMYADAVSYELEVAGWRDGNGDLWAPNTTVTVDAPDAFIYDYEFVIREVELRRNASSEITRLKVIPPGAFDGKQPPRLPWDT